MKCQSKHRLVNFVFTKINGKKDGRVELWNISSKESTKVFVAFALPIIVINFPKVFIHLIKSPQ